MLMLMRHHHYCSDGNRPASRYKTARQKKKGVRNYLFFKAALK